MRRQTRQLIQTQPQPKPVASGSIWSIYNAPSPTSEDARRVKLEQRQAALRATTPENR